MNRSYLTICFLIVVAGVAGGAYFFLKTTPKEPKIEGAKVLAVIAESFDYSEHTTVKSILKREGAIVTTASFTTEWVSGHVYASQGSYAKNYRPDITFDEINVSVYDVVFIPGGDGLYNIICYPDGQKVLDILIQAHNEGMIIAAICHGPWVLATANLVDGKNVTCWNDPPMIGNLIESGARVDISKSVIRDGNTITANGPEAMPVFAEEIINVLIARGGYQQGLYYPKNFKL